MKATHQTTASSAPTPTIEEDPEAETEESHEPGFPIVGIGASAGGLEAFSELLQALPSNTGMGFVFVQHLDPKHVSLLTELLQRHTAMPVQDATENIRVEPNHVYLIPRDKQLAIKQGFLTLSPRGNSPTPHLTIDPFLRSLAADQKSRAIGIILSGNASDGALGTMAIKAEGGITFAQSSETAKFDSMPRSAVAAGCIDFVLSPKNIGKELARLGSDPYVSPVLPSGNREPSAAALEAVTRILRLLRNTTGVDFSHYKASTIRRRILRRMALRRVQNLDRYVGDLRSDSAELRALYDDILINVTEFFRDPDVFEQLKKVVFPQILTANSGAAPIRIWVPGCSTGEEVYSIAITLMEYIGDRGNEINAQIFGTDISDHALDKARSGIYTPGSVQDLPAERLRRFFTKVDTNYLVSKRIREICVFAKQNLIKDPPFSRLDLISCRNVLIYFGPLLQKRVMPIFHYALKPKGFLLLGSSESIGKFSELFSVEDGKAKIYRRRTVKSRLDMDFPAEESDSEQAATPKAAGDWSENDLLREADRIVLGKYAPPGVIVDDELNVVQFRGRTAPYLEMASGTPSLNLLRMAREGLQAELQNALRKARQSKAPVRHEGIRVRRAGGIARFNLEVIPFTKAPGREARYLILFEEAAPEIARTPEKGLKQKGGTAGEAEAARLRRELQATKEYLQSIVEEHESSNEELRSANEEIQSSNEELQSTNEELETAKEELQSTNEELSTVNEELQTRNLQLVQTGNDLMNVLSNVNIPIIIVGNDMRIRRFTPISQRLLNLIPPDVGRPISDINLNLDTPNLEKAVAEVIDTLSPKVTEVRDLQGKTYSLRIRPYRTEDNHVAGAVIVLVDFESGRSNMEHVAEKAMTGNGSGREDDPKSSDELRAFGAGLLMAQEAERRNLSLELHDDLSQRLALLELNIETMQQDGADPHRIKEQLESVHKQIAALSTSLRKIAYQLHPAAIDDLGLAQAVESYVHDFSEREGIPVKFHVQNMPGVIDPTVALCLYRMVQEGLRNVAQHARAKAAEVNLSRHGNTILLKIKDYGSGFDVDLAKQKGRLGLRSMEERAHACGGTFKITSQPGVGTEVTVEVPEIGAGK